MNTYKISFTRENGTQGADHFTAATEAQARKDFGVCYRHSSATIVSVELVQTDAPATKQQEREAWLEKAMEEEKRAKLIDLIGRIMGTVGTITDAAALHIGPEGDINGYIVGTEGKAKIQTIGAGGYNIQCFHFRTLIHEMK